MRYLIGAMSAGLLVALAAMPAVAQSAGTGTKAPAKPSAAKHGKHHHRAPPPVVAFTPQFSSLLAVPPVSSGQPHMADLINHTDGHGK